MKATKLQQVKSKVRVGIEPARWMLGMVEKNMRMSPARNKIKLKRKMTRMLRKKGFLPVVL